jgi:hypothetical protein
MGFLTSGKFWIGVAVGAVGVPMVLKAVGKTAR